VRDGTPLRGFSGARGDGICGMAALDRGARNVMSGVRVTRIVVTGSESTGKTTLARDLASHFGAHWVPEQSRSYAERVRRELKADDVGPIASEQITAE